MGTVTTKFFTVSQNNSGGRFDHDDNAGIGYAICVEAVDRLHASARAAQIVDSYLSSGSCPCCGPRWSTDFYVDDGTEQPELWGSPLRGGWGIPSYIHYLDGRIEAVAPGEAA